MTSIRLLLAVGGLCLAGAVPTMAQTTQPAASPGTIAAPAATYDSYIATARTTLHGWRVELDAFDAKAMAEGRSDSHAAAGRLKLAWANAEAEAGKLRVTSATEWDRAKLSFEAASRAFSTEFDKVRPAHDASAAQ